MTMNYENGRPAGSVYRWRRSLAFALCLVLSSGAMAGNVLKDLRYSAASGGKVDITLEFSGPVGQVNAFTTDAPPRIAIDLPDTRSGLSQRRVVVGAGATAAVTAAEAGGRTRVVVDLLRPAGYTTRSAGNLLVLTVDAGTQTLTAASAMDNAADPLKRGAGALSVDSIDFRRGENGAGRIILRFTGEGAATDLRTEGDNVIVDVANAHMPERLRRRLDVTDFATPVQSLEPRNNAGGSRLVIHTGGPNESMAYQTGSEYVVEIVPKRVPLQPGKAMGATDSEAEVKRYAGRPVTFNFQDVPVRTVLQLIAEESSLNIVASDTVGGNLTLRLINVPWDQALEIILRAKSLDQRRDGNVVWVAPQKELAAYEQARADARIALEQRAELITEYIPINYGNAEDIAKLLTEDAKTGQRGGGGGDNTERRGQRGFLSPRGSVSFDARTNTILLVDTAKNVEEIKRLLTVIDRPVDQVLIEARIVVASETFARELGARFGVTNLDHQNASGNISAISGNLATSNLAVNAALAAQGTGATAVELSSGLITNLAVQNPAGSLAYTILRSSHILDLELSALEKEGRGTVLANPRVITSNQREAVIRQGQEIGYVTTTNTGGAGGAGALPTAQFKDAVLELKVVPTITSDGRVYLNVNVKKDDVLAIVAGVPSLAKREISTAVLVDNGQTVVVGGVYEFSSRDDLQKVPFFGDLPVMGNLFKKKGRTTDKAELLIFVTPRVLQVANRR